MKKIKLLTPILSVAALSATIAPIATSCSVVEEETNVIPTNLLDIVGYTLKGFKENADVSKYDTLVIPEGVKIIEDNAFENVFVTGQKVNNIRTVVIPKTVNKIKKAAFKGCNALRVFDFSTWTADEVHYLTTQADSFEGTSKLGRVITSDLLTDESVDKLHGLLSQGQLDDCWFAPVSEDKMSADAGWKTQSKAHGRRANYLFTNNVDIKEGTSLYAQVTKTGGTKGLDIELYKLSKVDNGYDLEVNLVNQEKNDEYVDFAVTFTAINDQEGVAAEPLWQQTITGFKLVNIQTESWLVEEIKLAADAESVDIGSTLQIQSEVLPEMATDKSVTWSSSNESVATVDENGLVTGVAEGEVTITATAKDGSGIKGYINLEVNPEGKKLEYDEDYGSFISTKVEDIKTDVVQTFYINLKDVPTSAVGRSLAYFQYYNEHAGTYYEGTKYIDPNTVKIIIEENGVLKELKVNEDYSVNHYSFSRTKQHFYSWINFSKSLKLGSDIKVWISCAFAKPFEPDGKGYVAVYSLPY